MDTQLSWCQLGLAGHRRYSRLAAGSRARVLARPHDTREYSTLVACKPGVISESAVAVQ
jgi:hypothetical protein